MSFRRSKSFSRVGIPHKNVGCLLEPWLFHNGYSKTLRFRQSVAFGADTLPRRVETLSSSSSSGWLRDFLSILLFDMSTFVDDNNAIAQNRKAPTIERKSRSNR